MDLHQHMMPRAHVFNHGTRHRDQITAALTRIGVTTPALNLPVFPSGPPRERLHG